MPHPQVHHKNDDRQRTADLHDLPRSRSLDPVTKTVIEAAGPIPARSSPSQPCRH